jgi:hypothetical protein
MQTTSTTQRSLVLSYLGLRKSIGIIGILLPFVLALGAWIFEGKGLLDSISAYYYSAMRDVFVGSLWAIAVFLFSYRFARQDDLAGDLAGIFAIGAAIFPVPPTTDATPQQTLIGWLHLVSAGGFFLTLAFFALVLFRKTDPSQPPTRRKLQRNRIYLFAGLVILAAVVLLVLATFLPNTDGLRPYHVNFWLETLAIEAFGVAWFVKGEAILKDK